MYDRNTFVSRISCRIGTLLVGGWWTCSITITSYMQSLSVIVVNLLYQFTSLIYQSISLTLQLTSSLIIFNS